MYLKLTRDKVFFIGLVIIACFLFLNRARFLIGSKTIVGHVTGYYKLPNDGRQISFQPVVEFTIDTATYHVYALKNLGALIGDSIEMIYQPSDPEGARVNTFSGVWLYPILFCLIPFMFWVSAAYSFITKKEMLEIGLAKRYKDKFGKESFKIIEVRKALK